MGVLSGFRLVEFEGLGPAPFCAMLFADLGADVILIERPGAVGGGAAIFRRGKRSIVLDLKQAAHCNAALKIAASADAVIEGLRPGVMERLGLGPDVLRALNPQLVYGRLTGWGQDGPLATAAGHDINYVGLSGAAWYAGAAGEAPAPPPTLVGDVAGGALYLAVGVLAAVLEARRSGRGAVVDAAIVDGSAHMLNLLLSLRAVEGGVDRRGANMLDGAPFYGVYPCADGQWVSLGALEPKFYALLLEKLGLTRDDLFAEQYDAARWPAARDRLAGVIAGRPREHWDKVFAGSDVCYAPVLAPGEAAAHPHIRTRNIYREVGGVLQTAAAPRFDGAAPQDPSPPPAPGAHAREILEAAGFSGADIAALIGDAPQN